MVFVMPLSEELAKFELISDKKIACGAKNFRIMKKYLEKRAEGAKNWHFCDNFRFFSELEKCQNNGGEFYPIIFGKLPIIS
jgi:hypothetical protein